MPLVFLIPMIALLVAVGVATGIKLLSADSPAPAKVVGEYPNPLTAESGKPDTFLGMLFSGKPTPSPSTATASDLSRELEATVDDGGASELDALEQELSQL